AGTGLGRHAADGTFRPLTHLPPLFAYQLAFLRVLGLEILPAARVANAILFGLAAILTGVLAWNLSGSFPVSALSSGIVLVSPSLIDGFSWVQSEPLFQVLMLTGLGTSRFHGCPGVMARGKAPSQAIARSNQGNAA
ncbi:MAG: hypothetical protein HW404_1554, partial [Anaerolineales bacterium]|nr:hypothetical protein [Anaerolineales bacterium]